MAKEHASKNSRVSDHLTLDSDKRQSEAGQNFLRVKVWSPFQTFFDGQAASISAENATGPFDILPQHHNFISILNPCELKLQTVEGEVKIKISGGVMQVQKDTVVVFLEI